MIQEWSQVMARGHAGKSPVLYAVMRERVLTEAQGALNVLRDGDEPSRLSVATSHLPMYVAALIAVMADHHPDVEGNCAACSRPGRWLWSRRVHLPCAVMLAIQLALSDPKTVLGKHLPRTGHVPVLTAR